MSAKHNFPLRKQRELAEKHFPEEWVATLSLKGDKRRCAQYNLRGDACAKAIIETLKKKNPDACCGNCQSLGNRSGANGEVTVCEAESDWQWYQPTELNGFCYKWNRVE